MSETFGIREPVWESFVDLSRRDCATKPRVARHELPWVRRRSDITTPTVLRRDWTLPPDVTEGATPLVLEPIANVHPG